MQDDYKFLQHMKTLLPVQKLVVRVYAIIVYEQSILLSDEFWFGIMMTKFPGGALEPGEGVIDCLKREIAEELHTTVEAYKHVYTTETFIMSQFGKHIQILPIYYAVKLKNYDTFTTSPYRFDFKQLTDGSISLRWIHLEQLNERELTFEIDRVALRMFLKQTQKL